MVQHLHTQYQYTNDVTHHLICIKRNIVIIEVNSFISEVFYLYLKGEIKKYYKLYYICYDFLVDN